MPKIHLPENNSSIAAPEGSTRTFAAIIVAVIALFATLAIYLQVPPSPLPESAPPDSFSAGRAMKLLHVIARNPHPLGSAEHDALRDYIVHELNALGVSAEVQKATVVNERRVSPYRVGTVQNIIARLPGTSPSRTVLLVGHYDSAPNSPGASDDGSGVAALLETARALKSAPPLKNDVVFLFTDGEEAGLLGAEAFVGEHSTAKNVGVVLNFEARGSSGPVVMFETSDRNGWLIREFARAAPQPVANSLSYEIYRRLPNDTDLTVFKRAGLEGLNFAYINQLNHYHTAADSVENIDPRSLQGQGSVALALARHFGTLEIGRHETSNAAYFNLLGPVLIHYPQWLVVPFAMLAALLFVGTVVLGFKRGRLRVRGMGLGFLLLLVCGLASSLVVNLMGWAIGALHTGYDFVPWGDVYHGGWYILGFVFLTFAISTALCQWFRRRSDIYSLSVGALIWWVVLAVATAISTPGASYLFTWPLLFALIGLCILFTSTDGGRVKLLSVLAVCIIPGIILLAPIIDQLFVALTIAAAGIIILFEVLLLGLLLPHLDVLARAGRWFLPGACALIAAGLILCGLLNAGFDRLHPKADNVFYALDADTGTAMWGSLDQKPDEWTAQFFGTGAEKGTFADFFPLVKRTFLKGSATPSALPPPQVVLLDDRTQQGIRTLQLRITSPRGGALLSVYVDASTEVVASSINGKPIKLDDTGAGNGSKGAWGMNYYGFPQEGAELILSFKTDQPVKLRVDDRTYGLPYLAEKPVAGRPEYMIPTPSTLSDVTLVSKSYTF